MPPYSNMFHLSFQRNCPLWGERKGGERGGGGGREEECSLLSPPCQIL